MPSQALQRRPAFRSRGWRVGNTLVSLLARLGVGPIHLLTTRGRRTGQVSTVPVVPVETGGAHWLVAPYGDVDWVHNVRASRRVTVRYGRRTRAYDTREAARGEVGPVLKQYVTTASKTRPYFAASPDEPAEAFVDEADRHPVFELVEVGSSRPSL